MRTVSKSKEFKRVAALPISRRTQDELETSAESFTELFKTPKGTMALRPIQAEMLLEAGKVGGLLAFVGVGHGKTLAAALIASHGGERPAILVPKAMEADTAAEIEKYRKHFKISDDIKIMTYSRLSLTAGPKELLEYEPTCIVADEAHNLKNPKSARTKRIKKYLKAHPECMFFALSGTLTTHRIEDFAHLSDWALGPASPLPRTYHTLQEWGRAVNSEKHVKQLFWTTGYGRIGPGALLEWYEGSGGTGVEIARDALHTRMASSPGVVMTLSDSCDQPLHVKINQEMSRFEISEHLQRLRDFAEGPNGEEYVEASDIWRVGRQLSMGFYSKWKPEPPEEWLDKRRAFNNYCRKMMNRGYDSPGQVVCGQPLAREILAWKEIEKSYEYNVESIWMDTTVVEYAYDWALRTGGLVWTEHVAVGKALHSRGLPYFGAGKKATAALRAHQGPAALSVQAHGTGKNLQRYQENLILSCAPSGAMIEQLMGRTHRQGQKKPVNYTFLAHTDELLNGLKSMYMNSKYLQEITKQPQKLLKAEGAKELRNGDTNNVY